MFFRRPGTSALRRHRAGGELTWTINAVPVQPSFARAAARFETAQSLREDVLNLTPSRVNPHFVGGVEITEELYTEIVARLQSAQDKFVHKLSLPILAHAICAALVCAQSSQVEEKRPVKRLVQPIVPELATKLNLTGTVKIEVTIASNGVVKTTRVIGGHPVLASAAESAAQKSTFEPGPKETVEVIEFKFSGK